jgi:hypothetical protein
MKKLLSTLVSRLSTLLQPRVEVLRARPLSDAQLLEALAVDADHPLLQAVLEVIDRAKNESRTNARAVIKSDRETVFALGAEEGLDRLQDYLLNLRAEAMRQRQQG